MLPVVPPAVPTLGAVGSGTSNSTYACTAADANGNEATLGATATVANGTLSSTVYDTIACPFTSGFSSFNIYPIANDVGLTQGKISFVPKGNWEKPHPANLIRNAGQATSTAAPTSNTTGQVKGASLSTGQASSIGKLVQSADTSR